MTQTQIELHNAHKARLQRIAAAAARLNPKTDREFSAALNAVEEPVKAEAPKDKWAEQQIERHKHHWFSVVSACKVAKSGSPTIKAIQRATCEVYGVELNDLLSARRTGKLITPRHVAMYLAKELTGLSLPAIGRANGGRDHTVPLYAHRKIEKLLKTSPHLAEKVALIRGMLA